MVEQIVGLVDQADDDVCDDFAGAGFDEGSIGFIRRIFIGAEFSHKEGFAGVFVPERSVSHSEKIAVIFKQFFEACACDVDQLDLGLARGPARMASFENVLLARPRRLCHLVRRSGTLIHETFAETDRRIVNDTGFLKR